ncbi:envelope stress response membrane protein PspC [Sphingosinicella sp. LHD-64]|uniref:envelope stress response membrane protein PspC n=1 Tax=Sphingosinicella sp. LHD-64 TaxID=3072139 RepID=UPI00280D1A82|nr:envelope stress response membrane protein PspC [Sphingosinicella sp. LHD-64]MDQ8755596.1 envelope stress response membrane protein PspC [Sphingosinicella sp. LHD-64]
MASPRTRFYLDKMNAKWSGVCAGIADYTGMDVTLVRVAVIGLTFLTGPWTIPAYFLTAWMAPRKPTELYESSREEQKFWQGVRANPRRTARDVRSRFRDIDRRLADMETYVTSSNSRLAREIEELR